MAKKQVKLNPPADASFPLSSMIDVVFLLLIFFLVTQKPITEEVLMNVDLPAPDPTTNPNDPLTPITIEVVKYSRDNADEIEKRLASLKEGESVKEVLEKEEMLYYLYNSSVKESRDIRRELQKFKDADSNPTIIIKCDANARFRKLVRLLDICNEYGMDSLNLIKTPGTRMDPEP